MAPVLRRPAVPTEERRRAVDTGHAIAEADARRRGRGSGGWRCDTPPANDAWHATDEPRQRRSTPALVAGVRGAGASWPSALLLFLTGFVHRLIALPARRDEEELLDRPGQDPGELACNLRDIRRVNRFFGGTSIVLRHVPRLIADLPLERPVTVLDLGTGSGDIPLALGRWAEATGRSVAIVASDASDEVLAVARRHVAGRPDVTLGRFDARRVPLPDKSVDIVLCSLALHHFVPADAIRVLREMDRLARSGFVVNDLRRSRAGFVAAWLAARLTTANRLTRHDAPLSVLRAYTPTELRDLFAQAGVQDAVVTKHAWFRMAAMKAVGRPHD